MVIVNCVIELMILVCLKSIFVRLPLMYIYLGILDQRIDYEATTRDLQERHDGKVSVMADQKEERHDGKVSVMADQKEERHDGKVSEMADQKEERHDGKVSKMADQKEERHDGKVSEMSDQKEQLNEESEVLENSPMCASAHTPMVSFSET